MDKDTITDKGHGQGHYGQEVMCKKAELAMCGAPNL